MGFLTDLATNIKTWANSKFAPASGSANYEPKNTNIQTHISTTGNPHGSTKSDIGLGNVTNDAQIKKSASSINGYVPTWNGTAGDSLASGYAVETTLSGSSSAIPRADGVKTYIDNAVSGVSSSGLKTAVQDMAALKALNTTSPTTYPDKVLILVENVGLYRLDRDSTDTGDDNRIVQPTTGVGRWFKMSSSINDHNNLSSIQGGATSEYYHNTLNTQNALVGTTGTPSGTNKFVTASDAKLTNLNATTGNFPVNNIDVIASEWTAFNNALNA